MGLNYRLQSFPLEKGIPLIKETCKLKTIVDPTKIRVCKSLVQKSVHVCNVRLAFQANVLLEINQHSLSAS